jgi:hypothetical protein
MNSKFPVSIGGETNSLTIGSRAPASSASSQQQQRDVFSISNRRQMKKKNFER